MDTKMKRASLKQMEYCETRLIEHEEKLFNMNTDEIVNEYETLKDIISKVFNDEETPYLDKDEVIFHLSNLMKTTKEKLFTNLYKQYKENK